MGLEDLLKRLATAFDSLKIPYMIIGGQAVMLYGEPRQTLDVDVTVRLSPADKDKIDALVEKAGLNRPREKQLEVLKKNLVLPLIDSASGIPVELIFSPYGFEDEVIRGAIARDIGGISVRFISADDCVIYKVIAGRPRDLEDIRGILKRSRALLDFDKIEDNLHQIESAMGRSDLLALWKSLR